MVKPGTVFFDIDGTLLDTTYLHTLAWWQALDQAGWHKPMAEIHSLIGMGSSELLTTLLGRDDDSISEAHGQQFADLHPLIRALPGASKLLRRVDAEGGRVILVTSAGRSDLRALLDPLECDDVITDVIHADMAENSKPYPDLFSLALERTGVAPEDGLAVGDAIWDVKAAGAAGIDCVGLECGGTDSSRLKWAGALAVYRTCADVLDRWASTPIARLLDPRSRRSSRLPRARELSSSGSSF